MALHIEVQIGPVKACNAPGRVLQAQKPEDILPDLGGGRGSKGRHHGSLGQRCHKVRDAQVAGPEILPPLGDAVSLVHGHQGDAQLPGQGGKAICLQPLRGHIQELVAPRFGLGAYAAEVRKGQGAIDVCCGNARLGQGGHLVLHERDQR